MNQKPLFITGNSHKAEHIQNLLGIPIDHKKLDIDEIQSQYPEEVIEHKVRQAYEVVQRPVFVDDFSFWFDELDDLPGTFIKFFVKDNAAIEKLCRLADGLASRRVTARAYTGYFDGEKVQIVHGELKGDITMHPRGNADYAIATDFVFAVDGYGGKTRAELSRKDYEAVYERVRAVNKVRKMLVGK